MEAEESLEFVHNYHIRQDKFVPLIWSQTNIFDIRIYLKYLAEDRSGLNYFNKEKQVSEELKMMRKSVVSKY